MSANGAGNRYESPSPLEVVEALERILDSPEFRGSARRKAFLGYLVDAGLAGHADRLKGYTIGIDVFGRDETFDSQTDPVVRIEARRLRRDLEHYYLTAGAKDPVRISIPTGSYAPAFEWQNDALPPAIDETSIIDTERQRGHDPRSTGKRSSRWSRLVVTVLAIAAVGAFVWHEFRQEARLAISNPATPPTVGEQLATTLPRGPRIAVVPLRNISGDPGQGYFSDGITEQIVTDLGRFTELFVYSMESTIKYKTTPIDPGTIRRELEADYVLAGRFLRDTDRIHVSVRLVDTSSRQVIWSKSYNENVDVKSILEMQQEVSRRVAAALGSRYGVVGQRNTASTRRVTTSGLFGYDCVMRYHYYLRSINRDLHLDVRGCLEQTVQRDPEYSEAWAALSNVYAQEYRFRFNPRPDEYDPHDRALEAANKAVELEPYSAAAQLVLANAYFDQKRLDAFERTAKQAVSLNPNNPDIVAHYAQRLAYMGEWDRGLSLMNKAMELNPFHPGWYYFPTAFFHYERGNYERALEESRNVNMPSFTGYRMLMTACLGQLGRIEEAQAQAQELLRLDPDYPSQHWQRLGSWNFPRPLIQQVADGLRKVGLDIPPPPATP